MSPQDTLLLGAFGLAVLLFIGGLSEAFGRRRRPARRRPKRRDQGIKELLVERLEAESLSPTQEAPPPPSRDDSASLRQPIPGTGGPLKRPAASWPSGLPSRPLAPLQEPAPTAEIDPVPPDQGERSQMVVHFRDGRVLKGYSYDFYPHKPHFHVLPPVAGFSFTDETTEVRIRDLKAIFFVRDLDGDPSYDERKEFAQGDRPLGRKVAVRFSDGELLVGTTVGYDRQRQGFFVIPVDPKSNNLKVFVVSASITNFRFL